jgi:hypothetical protein
VARKKSPGPAFAATMLLVGGASSMHACSARSLPFRAAGNRRHRAIDCENMNTSFSHILKIS